MTQMANQHEPTRLIRVLEQVTLPGTLAQEGLTDDEKLWAKLAAASETQLDSLFGTLGIGREQFLSTITPPALAMANKYGPTFFERRWFDLLRFMGFILVLALCASVAQRILVRQPKLEVLAAAEIRPFEPIRSSDIQLRGRVPQPDSLHGAAEVIGRYALREIGRGQRLQHRIDLHPEDRSSITGESSSIGFARPYR